MKYSINVAEIRTLRWLCGVPRDDRIRNKYLKISIASIAGNMREYWLTVYVPQDLDILSENTIQWPLKVIMVINVEVMRGKKNLING